MLKEQLKLLRLLWQRVLIQIICSMQQLKMLKDMRLQEIAKVAISIERHILQLVFKRSKFSYKRCSIPGLRL